MLPNKNATNPAKINLKNISNYLSAKLRAIKLKVFGYGKHLHLDIGDLFDHEIEQIIKRAEIAEIVGGCTSRGYCTYCGCSTKGMDKYKGYAACEKEGCYPEMMDKKDWEEFKIKNNIKNLIK